MNDRRIVYDAKRTGKTLAELEEEASLLGRRFLPQEVASLAVFLAGEEANAINAHSLNVCGGVCFD